MEGGIKSDERGVVPGMAAQEARQGLGKRLHWEGRGRRLGLIPVGMENLAAQCGEASSVRDDEMNLLATLRHRQAVVAHGGLAGEKSAMNTG